MIEIERFLEKVLVIPNGCWFWLGTGDENGYGMFWCGSSGRMKRAHRWAFEHFVADIPDRLVIDHLCRNPSCVNPVHLEPVTNAVNVQL